MLLTTQHYPGRGIGNTTPSVFGTRSNIPHELSNWISNEMFSHYFYLQLILPNLINFSTLFFHRVFFYQQRKKIDWRSVIVEVFSVRDREGEKIFLSIPPTNINNKEPNQLKWHSLIHLQGTHCEEINLNSLFAHLTRTWRCVNASIDIFARWNLI